MSEQTQVDFLQKISDKILLEKQRLIKHKTQLNSHQTSTRIDSQLQEWRENIVDIYALSVASDLETTFEVLKEWGREAVDTLVNYNLPLEIALDEVRDYRNLIGHIIKDEAIELNLPIADFYELLSDFDAVVDRAVHWLSISYTRMFYTRINVAEASALELSIPVIKISDKIGVLPIIGDIDTQRAQELMNKALMKSSEYSLEHLIIDLSGVPIIDTMVADRIFKVVRALSLLGINTILSGIRPEIAQTMVNLGVNVSDIPVTSDLHMAMERLLKVKIA
ncbi:STAS domain-containing protein [Mesobacillus sp. AQ2]|jgi:rsbT co-antagonist protein RsbR|uniref:STAS domain-containing protein n=1 Tax=Bacillaceae TaxID=186817 RepID=UPI0011A59965|nr:MULTISPECIES: STAS domain-containing protein [Bacillaceae]MCM3124462.1 STAS domain-containing protein [Mesobacillus sp. MER 33]MCM3234828.1 STAS domain-containing protein [Mesobacillus sp. MER 48]WHX41144.1 STAS domain-containing protein [Mesobacillus sp. AQ2]